MKKTRKDSKVDPIRLAEMLNNNVTISEAAREFGVTTAAIVFQRDRLAAAANDIPDVQNVEICSDNIDSMKQLSKVNNMILNELNRCNRLITNADVNIAEQEDIQAQLKINPLDAELTGRLKALSSGNTNDILKIQSNIISISAEVRKQIELQIKIAETLYNIQFTQEFQAEVLEAIKEASVEVRDKIVKKLKDRRIVRGLIGMKQ
jgi:transposase-like protein